MLLRPDSTASPEQQFTCWVSVGTLVLLRIGDVWSNQTLVATPDYQLETFSDLQVVEATVTPVKAGTAEGNDYLIPFCEHPWHLGGTHANCVCVMLPDDRRIVVPCMELIRFYFGSSSELLARLFTPPLKRKDLYDHEEWGFLFRHLTIHLSQGIRGASAADIARIAVSEKAWHAALSISTSCARASASGAEAHPKTSFPFEGATDLVASGKWLSFGERASQTFLVYNLRSCSHPFPFKKLRYKVAVGGSKNPSRGGGRPAASNAAAPRRIPAPSNADKQHRLQEQEASKNLSGATRHLYGRQRFRDLDHKDIWASRTLQTTSGPVLTIQSANYELAVGEASSRNRIRATSLVAMEDAKSPPEFLRELISTLQALPNVDVSLLTASVFDGWTIACEVHEAVVVSGAMPAGATRRLAVFLLDRPHAQALVIAIESDALTVLLRPCFPATRLRLVQDALEYVQAFEADAPAAPDLMVDLEEVETWLSLSTDWLSERLSDCIFPAHR